MSDPAYAAFFLNSRSDVIQLELIELTHPNFTQTFRIVRNNSDGVVVDLSPSEQQIAFDYYPAKVKQLGARDDLDAAIQVDLGDLGEVIPAQVDAVTAAGGFLTKPLLRYWTFRSDQLGAPIYGPLHLEVAAFNFNTTGTSFEAKAASLNVTRTGEKYKPDRFEGLAGFL